MDRLELIREQTDAVIQKLVKEEERKFAYIHTYGVAQAAAMLATLRKLDVELCCIAAMLHDIALYAQNCPHLGHAQRMFCSIICITRKLSYRKKTRYGCFICWRI